MRRPMRSGSIALSGLAALLAVGSAGAVEQPAHLKGRPELEVASGAPVRVARRTELDRVPPGRRRAWQRLARDFGGVAHATWDTVTGVPSRIWGLGPHAPGVVASATVAERRARDLLARHIELLAPGASPADFVLASNDRDAGIRTVGFTQRHRGLAVLGGQVSFRFKNDRLALVGSEALPAVTVPAGPATVSHDEARAVALASVRADVATRAAAGQVEGPFVLPLVSVAGVRYATVLAVTVEASAPRGRWVTYVDAHGARPIARRQTLRFASGKILYDAPERWPGGVRKAYPAAFAELDVDGAPVTADAGGVVSWSGDASAAVTARCVGSAARVFNQAGGEITTSLTLAPGAEIEWDASDSQYTDAQLATFIHTSRVVDYARGFAPTLPLLSAQMDAYVNINDSCNAFYDGKSINFFRGQGGCGNTGRIADIVYHEFGHALHDNGILPGVGAWDGALSEGLSDFLAATITDDPAMGRGFFGSDKPLRHIDPPDGEHVWPEDIGEIHYTGLIIAGALWDMRKKLVADLGPAEGVAVANHIFYQALRRAVDIPSMYFEALLADDDDGDLTNGTPHACAIIEGFAPHGLRTISAVAGKVAAMPPGLAGYPVSLALLGMHEDCPAGAAATAEVEWRLRAAPEVGGVLSMKLSGPAFVADIPPPPDGSVVQYRIRLAGEGKEELFPDNPADPYYELFVGHVEPLYCTDFESDPFAAGWTHALSGGQASEGADDWQWGAPAGAVEPGDPPFAFSGDNVIGNDLGLDSFNGAYQPNKVNEARSPAIAIAGDFDAVRLHYRRWLNVEDAGFDQANIYASGALVWQNAAGDELHHRDREWRFHDVELSAQAAAGSVELAFELASDGGLNLGGWTLDDVCVVGFVRTECGDGRVTGLEQCDQGALNSDTTPDACRSDCTPARCGDGVADTAEECDDGNEESGDGCSATCAGESGPGDPGGDDGAGVPVVAPSEPPPFGGCGCRAAARTGSSGGLAALALLLGLACARRRSRRVTVCSR